MEHLPVDPAAANASSEAMGKDIAWRWILASPALLLIFCGAIGPLFVMVLYSVLAKGEYGGVVFWNFSIDGWYGVLFKRDYLDGTVSLASANLDVLWRSVWLALLTTAITLFLGFPTAYFIATRKESQRTFWMFLITVPFWTNLLIRTFSLQEVLRNEGIVNLVLLRLHLIERPIQILFTEGAILFGMVYIYFPLMVLPLYASMEKLDFRLMEAGYDLYATRSRVLRRLIIPLVKPGIVAGCALVFIPSIGAYVIPRVLGGGKSLMLGNLIELQFGQARNWPLGAALSLAMMVMCTAGLVLYMRKSQSVANHG